LGITKEVIGQLKSIENQKVTKVLKMQPQGKPGGPGNTLAILVAG
jgi:hypothetical protein